MPFAQRPSLSLLLCLLLACGHLPAWLHVVLCDDHAVTHVVDNAAVADATGDDAPHAPRGCGHAHGEHEHGAKDHGAKDHAADAGHGDSSHQHSHHGEPHDHRDCVICQSLYGPSGLLVPATAPLVCTAVQLHQPLASDADSGTFRIDRPAARGPPSLRFCV